MVVAFVGINAWLNPSSDNTTASAPIVEEIDQPDDAPVADTPVQPAQSNKFETTYSIQEIYDQAMNIVIETITSRVNGLAWLWGIGLVLLVVSVGMWFLADVIREAFDFLRYRPEAVWSAIGVIAIVTGLFGGWMNTRTIPGKIDITGHALADKAINDGVESAKDAQSTYWQYIHANIIGNPMKIVNCAETTSPDTTSGYGPSDFCAVNTPYYTHREVDQWTETKKHHDCTKDTETGEETCNDWTEYIDHWKDQYTPWFDSVNMYLVIPDTKAKYLAEQIYHQQCLAEDGVSFTGCSHDEKGRINDSRRPVIALHADWRAPVDVNAHRYTLGSYLPGLGSYNNHVPDSWALVEQLKSVGGPVFDATFVGPYFNWGFAANSPMFEPFTGHYDSLRSLVAMPGPSGKEFSYTNAFGQPDTIHTMLTSTDGDLPMNFNPIYVVGSCLSPEMLAGYPEKAMEVQGNFGPKKQGSLRWFFVCDSLVQRLGGVANVTTALKAFLRDEAVHGLFSMPQNLVIIVNVISDDGARIIGRDMATGMPAGNVLVMQRIRMSIEPGTSLPLTIENAFGVFNGNYIPSNATMVEYQYSDLTQAGGPIGLLYEQDPNYTPPDPSSKDCELAKADHLGFVRYSGCNVMYLRTTIQVNEQGKNMILANIAVEAEASVPMTNGWVFFWFMLAVLLATIGQKSGMFDNFRY